MYVDTKHQNRYHDVCGSTCTVPGMYISTILVDDVPGCMSYHPIKTHENRGIFGSFFFGLPLRTKKNFDDGDGGGLMSDPSRPWSSTIFIMIVYLKNIYKMHHTNG